MNENIDIEDKKQEKEISIYIISNPLLINKFRIGISSKKNLDILLDTINKNILLPEPFKYEYVIKLNYEKGKNLFNIINFLFKDYFDNEYFNIDIYKIIISIFKKQNIKTNDNIDHNDNIENNIEDNIENKNSTLYFYKMGFINNDILIFKDLNKGIFIKIISNNKVLYNDKEYSLIEITKLINKEEHSQKPLEYWLYKNETLLDIYNRTMTLN